MGSSVTTLFVGLSRNQARQLQLLSMPVLWSLRDAIETGNDTLTVDLTTCRAPSPEGGLKETHTHDFNHHKNQPKTNKRRIEK